MKFPKDAITQVTEPDSPVVRGCTESRALVKSAMSFRGPPSARCCRWYFFSSDKGTKRFIILWYWMSTWERRVKKNSWSCLSIRDEAHLLVYHAPFGVVWLTAGVEVDVFLIKLCVVHVRFPHDLDIKQSAECLESHPITASAGQKQDLPSWVLLSPAPCSCCGRRRPSAPSSSAS